MPVRTESLWRWLRPRAASDGGGAFGAGETFSEIRRELTQAMASPEEGFLEAGGRLLDLRTAIDGAADGADSLAGLLSEGAGSLSALDQALLEAAGVSAYDEISRLVGDLHGRAHAIHGAIQNIEPIVRTFAVLAVMTRVESARFGGGSAAFAGLADSVRELSGQIAASAGASGASAKALLDSAAHLGRRFKRLAAQREQSLGPLSRATGEQVRRRSAEQARVAEASDRIAARFRDISASAGDIVAAMQGHDIVRQQIEHVLEVLEGATAAGTTQLEAAQLDHSRVTFERSVTEIRAGLEKIETEAGQVAEESDRLFNERQEGPDAGPSQLESGLETVAAILGEHAAADRELAQVAQGLLSRLSGISGTVASVQSIGIEMRRNALNAAVQVAQLGSQGQALETIAAAIQALAHDVEQLSAKLDSESAGASQALSALVGRAGEQSARSEERFERLRDGARRAAGVRRSAESVHGETKAAIAAIRADLRETIEAFGTHQACLAAIRRAGDVLRTAAAGDTNAGRDAWEAARSLYTMRSERLVHKAMAERESGVAVEAAPDEDNVEFF